MGAIAIKFKLPGYLSLREVKKEFTKRRHLDYKQREQIGHLYDPGHLERGTSPYTPDFYSFTSCDVFDYLDFKTLVEAENYCLDNSEKWLNCVAVRYGRGKKKQWLVCGWGPI